MTHEDETAMMQYDEAKLVALLEKANEVYHNTSQPLYSDDYYDAMKARLRQLNPKHPFLKKVGAPPRGDKVKLPYFLGSLDKIRDDPKHLVAFKKKYPGHYVASDKLDGVSALIVYHPKKQTAHMYSRGDGTYGQDISRLIHLLDSIPKIASLASFTSGASGATAAEIAVRGELILTRADWKKLEHKGANARNMVAGTVNAKNPDPDILRAMKFVAYELLTPKELPSQAFVHLKQMGFTVPFHQRLSDTELTNEVLSRLLIERRAGSAYECDGIVVRHDAEHKYIAGKNPGYAFAYKSILMHDEAEVIVQEVQWNISKDGFLKPTLVFDAVHIAGVKIQRATGFNAQFIEKNTLGPGARVVIIRSGDVIPHVVRVVSGAANGKPSFPAAAYEWTDTHVDIVATGERSDEQALRQLEFAVKQLEIKYLATGTLAKLYEAGLRDLPAILNAREADFVKIDGIQAKMAKKLYDSIQATRAKAGCIDYLNASGVFGRGIGRRKLEGLVAAYPEILVGTAVATKGATTGTGARPVEGMTEKTVVGLLALIPEAYKVIRAIDPKLCSKAAPPSPASPPGGTEGIPGKLKAGGLEGKQVVFTGFRNKDWEELLKAVGARVATGVSKKVALVVAADPEESSSKMEKAHEYGIPIQSKDAFARAYGLKD